MTRSRTSLFRANNGTFSFKYTVIRKHLKTLKGNMCNSTLMNNLKMEKKIEKLKSYAIHYFPLLTGADRFQIRSSF